jgi:hypothetical protein
LFIIPASAAPRLVVSPLIRHVRPLVGSEYGGGSGGAKVLHKYRSTSLVLTLE